MPVIYGLLLQTKGEVKRIKLCDTKETSTLTSESLQSIIKKKTPLQEIGVYEHGDIALTLFGYTSGKAGTENKHELPPPLNETQLYSDILLIASKSKHSWTQPIPFTPEQYESFYSSAFNGADEQDDDSSESDSMESESDSDEEKEDEDELHIQSAKKKAAVEDGVPEDEEDDSIEDEEEGDDDSEGGEEREDGGSDGEGGYDEPVPKVRAASKKKPAKGNTTVVQNTGRAKQQALLVRPGFQELIQVGPIPTQECAEQMFRQHTLSLLRDRFHTQFTEEEMFGIERAILTNAMTDADIKFVVKHFDNTLFQLCYTSASRRLLANLDPTTYVHNEHLLQKIKHKDLQIEHLASMNVMDYAPNLYAGFHDRMLLREQQQLEGNKAMATDMFKCNRCGKRETTFYELQTRSADEPMTKFITCVNCGKRWRM